MSDVKTRMPTSRCSNQPKGRKFALAGQRDSQPPPLIVCLSSQPPLSHKMGETSVQELRDTDEVQALIAEYFARQLLTLTKDPSRAICIDELPLARIKRIMKQDSCEPHPRQVSADTVPFVAYAAQLFIGNLTSLAWKLSTQRAKRNTLQVKDLKVAVLASSQHDFLIDTIDLFDAQQREQRLASQPMPTEKKGPTLDSSAMSAFGAYLADELLFPSSSVRSCSS